MTKPKEIQDTPTTKRLEDVMWACHDALVWIGSRTIRQAWEQCQRSDWMEWLISDMYSYSPGNNHVISERAMKRFKAAFKAKANGVKRVDRLRVAVSSRTIQRAFDKYTPTYGDD